MSDHARGCEGRNYTCTCGYDAASTALVERLTDEQLRDIADSKDTATCRARLLAALSASTSREGER